MTAAIACRGLTKTYPGGRIAIADVDLTVDIGQVYGLVGRNGAGKTTLMRVLVGLVRATSGTAQVLGVDVRRTGARADIGSLIEAPAFYPHLSGGENLRLLSRYLGLPGAAVEPALDRVGLADRAGSRFSSYSLGMKQRLGMAAALLGDPLVLVLDEPVNGLDPQAIVAVRAMLDGLRAEGRTVLLSSHLLGEVEQVCDRVAVIDAGRVVAEGTPADLRDAASAQAPVVLAAADARAAARALAELTGVVDVRVVSETDLEVDVDGIGPPDVVRVLVTAGVEVWSVQRGATLEAAYLAMTADPASAEEGRP